jgi:hypothetical protein
MSVAVFNVAGFLLRYPEFTAVDPALLTTLFAEAGLYLNNTDRSVVQDVNLRGVLLNQITAHIAFLGGALTADGQPRPVGRVSAANEGAVGATLEYTPATPGSGAWYQQSAYGAAFWQATTCYRGFHYSPQPTVVEGFTGTSMGTNWLPPPVS